MTKPKFQIGDRVVVATQAPPTPTWLVGLEGTVVNDYTHRPTHVFDYGVAFDEPLLKLTDRRLTGHTCGGTCKNGYGWNVDAESLALTLTCPKINASELL